MSIDLDQQQDPFISVHICVHCGSSFRSEEFEDRAHTTGIYLCSKCGVEGPLNLEIRAVDALEKESNNSK